MAPANEINSNFAVFTLKAKRPAKQLYFIMGKTFRNFFYLLAAVSAFALFSFSCSRPQTRTIFIISTNDIHGAIDKIPNLATLVGEYRAQDTAQVLLVDAGDRWTGNPYVDMAPTPGLPIIELMNELGYDVATFGNHEFDLGLAHLDSLTKMASFDVILANIDTGDTPLSQPAPYKIFDAGGSRIAFIGLITNFINGHPDGKDSIFEGTSFPSPFDAAEKYAFLRDSADIFVAVTHIGDDADSILVARVKSIDLVIGGHTHVAIAPPRIYGKSMVTQTGNSLKYAGVTEITMRGDKIVGMANHLVKLDTIAPHPRYAKMLERYTDNPELQKTVGTLTGEMTKEGLANMFTDVSQNYFKTDFAFYHIGGVRMDSFAEGEVRMIDLFGVEPFGSTIYKVRMTLPQIRQMIINKFNNLKNPKEGHRPDLYPSGMKYTVITDETGKAVDVVFDHGYLPYDKDRLYTMAISDYAYLQYDFEKPAIEEVSPLLTGMLADWFAKNSPVTPDNSKRISIRER